jgi:ParB family chromosome partitioning protein
VKVRVSEIHVKDRIRQSAGEISELAESIKKYGLLQPILIDVNNNLIAGYRRLLAVKSLGWEYIEVKVIDVKNPKERILLEMEENKFREDFTKEEWERSTEFLEKYNAKNFFQTLEEFWNNIWRKKT